MYELMLRFPPASPQVTTVCTCFLNQCQTKHILIKADKECKTVDCVPNYGLLYVNIGENKG